VSHHRQAEAQIARGAGIVMAGFALSSVIGLLNRMLYSGVFGTGVSLDAFLSANRVPDILFNLMAGGALASAFIPIFATFLTQNDRPGGWRLASSILNLLILGLGLAAALVWIAAPWIVPNLLVPGYEDPAQIALTVDLLRIQLIALVLFGLSGLVMAILNAHQRFALPALAPSLNWLGWIIGIFVLVPTYLFSCLACADLMHITPPRSAPEILRSGRSAGSCCRACLAWRLFSSTFWSISSWLPPWSKAA
jgi:putative peptidoglycan lipid II flippase